MDERPPHLLNLDLLTEYEHLVGFAVEYLKAVNLETQLRE